MPWSALEERLTRQVGIDPTTLSKRAVEGAIKRRMQAHELTEPAAYVAYVERHPSEFDMLAAAVMVHETSFFRYPASFDLLVREVRTRHLDDPSSTFRVHCVGCSTGEEPSSVVIALLEAGIDTRRARVDASDISARALAYARAGRYREPSTRRVPPGVRHRYFRRDGNRLQLDSAVTEQIHFRRANVMDPAFGFNAVGSYDALFCRNVLIYFVPEARRRLLDRLIRMLKPGGLLFVGHAEVAAVRDLGLSLAPPHDAFACRLTPKPKPKPAPARTPPVAVAPTVADESTDHGVLARASSLADQGALEEARRLLRDAIGRSEVSADLYHLLANVESARANDTASEDALRKAIYLDGLHYPSLAQLALLVANKSDGAQEAARLRARAERVREDWEQRQAHARMTEAGRDPK